MTDTLQWIRVFTHLLVAINFGLVALALMVFMRRHDIGHRTLIRLGIVFNMLVCGDSIFGAWILHYHRHSNAYAMMRFGTAVFGTAVVVYFITTNQDLIRTLRISEFVDRARKDKVADQEQMRSNLTYVSQETLKRSQAMIMACCDTKGASGDGGTTLGDSRWSRSSHGGGSFDRTSYPRT
jgi:hypothetical protein